MAATAVENVKHVVGTLLEQSSFVYNNLDWQELREEVVQSEVLYLTLLFLVGKAVLPKLEDTTRRAYLTPFLKVYNLCMVLYSAGSFIAMHQALTEVKMYSNDCTAAFAHPLFETTARIFYYSKFFEFIDSFGLVMAGKRVSFLQTWHHFGAPWDMWLFVTAKHEGLYIFVYLNSFVHTIMYAYYLLTLMKIPFPAKPLITVMQIVQFHLGFYLIWWYKDIKCYTDSPRLMFGWIFNHVYVGGVLLLFINFSIWTYICTPKKPRVKKE
eukprot:TRINITY_DN427_c0_g5_i1.p1 TRINITY_DN427_c0_g5~~TRINITY_DN427_c0_g5_i1.p1  ORF type:complete len:268 (+),score=59.63 TRINITY_DN427_c0_g5_i1:52-855(+)